MTYTIFLVSRCIALVNNTMSACCDRRNDKQQTLLYTAQTHVWIISSRNIRTSCESEESDCPCKVEIAPLYRKQPLCKPACRLTLLFQVQEIVLRKMRCTNTLIFGVELFWNSVVNTTEPLISSSVLFGSQTKYFHFHNEQHNSVSITWCWWQHKTTARINSSI